MVGSVLILALAGACSAEPQLTITAFGPCEYEGPSEVAAGVHEFVVSGEAIVDVYILHVGANYDDIVAHYVSLDARRHAPGGTRIFTVVNRAGLHHDRSTQNATSRRHTFTPGEYALVCEWSAGDSSGRRAISQLSVSD
jgi:hypothetical protein